MKLSEQYMVQEIMDSYVMLPVGQNVVNFKNVLQLNETGFYIVSKLQTGIGYDELVQAMKEEFEATNEEMSIIRTDLDRFLKQLREAEALEE